MKKRDIQINRMLTYFIDATAQIIEKEGIENVTIRKIADIAGYNSATIYNYFGELSHLIFFAALKFIKGYIKDLSIYMASSDHPLEKYLLSWECFCKHSFKDPHIYHAIFIANLGEMPSELFQRYYNLYQSDLIDIPEDLKSLILEDNLSKRSRTVLEKSVKEGYIKEENLEAINEMTILIWQGMLTSILNKRREYDLDEAMKKTMSFIRQVTLGASNLGVDADLYNIQRY